MILELTNKFILNTKSGPSLFRLRARHRGEAELNSVGVEDALRQPDGRVLQQHQRKTLKRIGFEI